MTNTSISVSLPNIASVEALGHSIFQMAMPGTSITLSGEIGVGKTTLARSIICAALEKDEEVPSPTFTLVQTYEIPSGIILWHFDLYRLTTHEEAWELGIEDAFAYGISLIEWPERLGPLWPPDRLDIIMVLAGWNNERQAFLQGRGLWEERIGLLGKGIMEQLCMW